VASITPRPRKDKTIAYLVEWREGGTRSGARCSDTINSEQEAETFATLVEAAGHHWPEGWVKGLGFVTVTDPGADIVGTVHDFVTYADGQIAEMTDVDPGTKKRYRQQARTFAAEVEALISQPVTVEGLTESHIKQWINWRKVQPKGGSGKTISNYHGFLHQVMAEAHHSKLRPDNPCERTGKKLPRRANADLDNDEAKVFLSEAQWTKIYEAMKPDYRDFITVLVGPGCASPS
jgi:hypothetical protein